MRWSNKAAVDANWHEFKLEGKSFYPKKSGGKVTRSFELIYRIGERTAQARTIGTVKVEDITVELDFAAGIQFLGILGLSDFNPETIDLAGRSFEFLDIVTDPRPGPVNTGTATTIYKDSEIVAIETSTEQGSGAPDMMIFTISALKADQFRGAAGGGVRV
jgi:hypothetical protein